MKIPTNSFSVCFKTRRKSRAVISFNNYPTVLDAMYLARRLRDQSAKDKSSKGMYYSVDQHTFDSDGKLIRSVEVERLEIHPESSWITLDQAIRWAFAAALIFLLYASFAGGNR